MNIKGKSGSKERLFEMMQGVNRTRINENYWKDNLNKTIKNGIDLLKSGNITDYASEIQSIDDASYVGINGYDPEKNMYNFNFKIEATEGGIDGVASVDNVNLEEFSFENSQGQKIFDVNQDDLTEFNKQHGAELYDVIEKYVDIDDRSGEEDSGDSGEEKEVESGEDIEENIDKKEESDPYGGSSQDYQDGDGYVDEKPVNSKLRTNAPSLGKYVKEDDEPQKWGDSGKFKDFGGVMKFVKEEDIEDERENTLSGEQLIRKNFRRISSDMEFRKMAQAYENLMKMKKNELRSKKSTQMALSSLRDLISEYLREVKELNVTEEDVQNFFEYYINKFGNVISENEENGNEVPEMDDDNDDEVPAMDDNDDEVPAMDVNDVDNDGDKLEGGVGDDNTVMDFDPEQILKGIEVEMEHTKDPQLALEIAMDHLIELPDYYSRLDKMEDRGEDDWSAIDDMTIDTTDGDDDIELDDNMPEEFKDHADEINNADKELKNTMLGYSTETPNTNEEDE